VQEAATKMIHTEWLDLVITDLAIAVNVAGYEIPESAGRRMHVYLDDTTLFIQVVVVVLLLVCHLTVRSSRGGHTKKQSRFFAICSSQLPPPLTAPGVVT